MRPYLVLTSFLLVCSLAACGAGVSDDDVDGDEDEDGDRISNVHEGYVREDDTDGDGTRDYLDLDSDNDGVPDMTEAGDDALSTPPVDSDEDGLADFRDPDSDQNGRGDGIDGVGDVDIDGRLDFADRDDDGDLIPDTVELGADPAAPRDTDADTIGDFRDTDSDADTIRDVIEGAEDYDGDGTENYRDTDADGDCLPDSREAGGDPPRDTDGDGRHDFLDRDSDGDGLADGDEDFNCDGIRGPTESDPLDPDTDDDGVTDLVEVHAGTNANNPFDNPSTRGDFFFLIPYEMPTTPLEDTLRFRTSVQFADLYFSFDITGSMGAELDSMAAASGVPAIINNLTCPSLGGACSVDQDCETNGVCFDGACIRDPLLAPGCVPNLWTGVGHWYDRNTFRNLVSLQSNPLTTAAAIDPPSLPGGSEAVFQAAECVADGVMCSSPMKNCAASGVGCPGFRDNAVRILIQISDADNQCSSCAQWTAMSAGLALMAKGIKFIGLYGTDDNSSTNPATPADDSRSIGIAAGSISPSGQPFVYSAVDSQVVPQTGTAVLNILNSLPLNVTLAPSEMPNDHGDALRFIDHLVVNTSGGQCTNVMQTVDTNADGYHDAFPRLTPGTRVCWDVVPIASNTIAPAMTEPQLFIARITVNGDGSPLDQRDIFFLVPPVLDEPVD